jgi:hypothetical protein
MMNALTDLLAMKSGSCPFSGRLVEGSSDANASLFPVEVSFLNMTNNYHRSNTKKFFADCRGAAFVLGKPN